MLYNEKNQIPSAYILKYIKRFDSGLTTFQVRQLEMMDCVSISFSYDSRVYKHVAHDSGSATLAVNILILMNVLILMNILYLRIS